MASSSRCWGATPSARERRHPRSLRRRRTRRPSPRPTARDRRSRAAPRAARPPCHRRRRTLWCTWRARGAQCSRALASTSAVSPAARQSRRPPRAARCRGAPRARSRPPSQRRAPGRLLPPIHRRHPAGVWAPIASPFPTPPTRQRCWRSKTCDTRRLCATVGGFQSHAASWGSPTRSEDEGAGPGGPKYASWTRTEPDEGADRDVPLWATRWCYAGTQAGTRRAPPVRGCHTGPRTWGTAGSAAPAKARCAPSRRAAAAA
mmetsp:Transcript_36832/g.113677  ORF Transcript_36832/g.113677 Transcript_36832/m.113677 type:complete len:261 (+) Transcript_36832:214-996(+)